MIFKGYIPTKDKASLMQFKNNSSELFTYDQAKVLSEFGGVLNDNVILIDIDDKKESDLLLDIVKALKLKCRVHKTNRGKHFFFLNDQVKGCKTHTKLAIGLTADIKIGSKNSYAILKYENKMRKVLYDTQTYEVLPSYLLPVKSNIDFIKMKDGDGRNSALYKYILTLQNHNFTIDEIKNCIKLINKYILKDPLDDNELETILRDEAFQKPKKNKFSHDEFGNFLIKELHIIKLNGQLHMYKDGVYVNGDFWIESSMLEHMPTIKQQQRTEVIKYIKLKIKEDTQPALPHLIAFNNGIYNLLEDTLQEFSPDIIITNRIPWDFNTSAYSKLADDTLNKLACFDTEIRQILEECIGSCFYPSNTLGGGKAFILTGEGANGKSTFLTIIQNVLGEDNISSLDLKELDVKFQNTELFGKLANIGDDISDEFIVNASIFKKLVTGNRIQVQRKGERPFEFNNFAKMLFSANTIPRIKDKTGAVLRRLVIIPFNAKFTSNDPDFDPAINYKLQSKEVMEYIIQLGIKGLKRVIINKKFTHSVLIQNELAEYNKMNNPILLFFKEVDDGEYKIINEPISEVYSSYKCFCINNGFKEISKIEFGKQVCKYYNCSSKLIKINGKVIRVYTE